ncbi:MAG: virulence RhuM family protein [Saprospiraceae bacterium]|nr:virulence RhuM family protein [Saprospiraceae bacterium]MCB0574466.1 virulence RhuM family protein [Saprospiraceae bacterium]MCB9355399.1 virulence RhuM family protein [Lewinellaceae bacterium]
MPDSEMILYQSEDGQTKVEVRMEGETVWLTLNQLAELFQRDKSVISRHIKNVFEEGELLPGSVVAKFATTAADGKTYQVDYYNLDMIISVGYRVNSHRGTQFRIWATGRLREYIIKGFALDDERLKRAGQMNYFDELLARIRDIRSSEKVFYQKAKDIYATSIDYDADHAQTVEFFRIVQNKLLWAVSKKTAAEIIRDRANAANPNMGLTTWAGAKVRKGDVTVAKNYLNEEEITALNLLVEQYLAFAEAQAQQRKPMYMKDWIKRLNDILTINEREVLEHAGKIRKELADEMAAKQYEKFKARQQAVERGESLNQLEADLQKAGKMKK